MCLSNPDYVLAWIGVEDHDEQEIMPLVVDGSTTMSCDECQECFSALLAAQEGEEPAYEAFKKGAPVFMPDVLAEAPKGPFKNTPLAGGRVDSVSLPMVFDGNTYGVLTIYSTTPGGLLPAEAELLFEMATLVAAKAHSHDIRDKNGCSRIRKKYYR